jgi:hypothetical protein
MCSTTLTVFADETQTAVYDSTDATSSSTVYQQVPLSLERAECYEVTLPRSITLDGSEDSSSEDYTITVNGEILSSHYVRVIPIGTATLTNEDGSKELTVNVTQTKRRWNSADLLSAAASDGSSTTGTIEVDNVQPGKWSGHINFRISLDDGGVYRNATCYDSAQLLGYDSNDNGVLDVSEMLDNPVSSGSPLGHTFSSNDTAFPKHCIRCDENIYALTSASDVLTLFSTYQVYYDTYKDVTFELYNDIDMNYETIYNTLGENAYKPFTSNFEGNGHTISNMHIYIKPDVNDTEYYAAVFGFCGSNFGQDIRNVVFKNLEIELEMNRFNYANLPCTLTSADNCTAYVGGLVAYAQTTLNLTNCHVYNERILIHDTGLVDLSIAPSATIYAAGLIGYSGVADSYIEECSVTGYFASRDITQDSGYLAGLANMNGIVGTVSCIQTYSAMTLTSLQFPANFKPLVNSNVELTDFLCMIASSFNFYDAELASPYISDTTVSGNTAIFGTGLTTEEMQSSSEILDGLNYGNDYTWVHDLEGIYGFYPYVKQT